MIGTKIKKWSVHKWYVNGTLLVALIGMLVFAVGFGCCMHISRTNADKILKKSVQDNLTLLHTYIDGQLNAVENIVYALCWSNNRNYAVYAPMNGLPEKSMETLFKSVLNMDSLVSGVTIAFAPPYCGRTPGQYGFAIYSSNIKGAGKNIETFMYSDKYDYTIKDWYIIPMSRQTAYWTKPGREVSSGDMITSFCLPLVDKDCTTRLGVIALDICMDRFHGMCSRILPYSNSKTIIIDEDLRFAYHPDHTKLMKDIDETENGGYYSELKRQIRVSDCGCVKLLDGKSESLLYFEKIPRTRWTICIECPVEEIYGESNALGRKMMLIALISVFLLTVCFRYLYRKLVKITLANANMERDLKFAAEAQKEMVPHIFPPFPLHKGIDLAACLHPARDVGGDLYDYFIQGDNLFFCIGDVSGKGLQAALFMAATHYLFRRLAVGMSVSDAVKNMNVSLCADNDQCRFVTFWFGCLDLSSGALEYVNAGHNAPVLVRANKTEAFPVSMNMPLGVLDNAEFVSSSTTLEPGDMLLLYTDGVTEAMDSEGHEFGSDKLIETIKVASNASASGLIESVLIQIRHHTFKVEQSDDITMLCLKFIMTEIKS